jgi:hypothetical protein
MINILFCNHIFNGDYEILNINLFIYNKLEIMYSNNVNVKVKEDLK